MGNQLRIDRRAVLAATLASFVPTRFANAQIEVTRPVVPETVCPVEIINPLRSSTHASSADEIVGALRAAELRPALHAPILYKAGFADERFKALKFADGSV